MASTSTASRYEEYWDDEEGSNMNVPPSEQAQVEPRFRVVSRKPFSGARKRGGVGPVQRAILMTFFPALLLVGYVLFSTLNMRGEYERDRLKAEIRQIHVERQELEAEIRRRQAPGRILQEAKNLGMEPASQREFAKVPGSTPTDPIR